MSLKNKLKEAIATCTPTTALVLPCMNYELKLCYEAGIQLEAASAAHTLVPCPSVRPYCPTSLCLSSVQQLIPIERKEIL